VCNGRDESLRDLKKAEAYALKAVAYSDYRDFQYVDTPAEVYGRRGDRQKELEVVNRAMRQRTGASEALDQLRSRRDRLEKSK